MIVDVIFLVAGLGLLVFSSRQAVDSAIKLATSAKVAPLIIGIVILAFGTSLPEIAISVDSAVAGHGDINVGNSFGSLLSQITLILGLVVLVGGTIHLKRNNVLVLGGCAIVAAILAVLVVEKGMITRVDGLLLFVAYAVLLFFSYRYLKLEKQIHKVDHEQLKHLGIILLGLIGVGIGAHFTINSVISLSAAFALPEYLISFFAVGLGTSLPELVVDLVAVSKKQYGLAVGNLLGSNLMDATIGLGAGPLIAPHVVGSGIATATGWYVIFASAVVVLLFALREKLDRKAAIVLLALYFTAFLIL
ncbi:sodium:calcium antiporter [archaeon]